MGTFVSVWFIALAVASRISLGASRDAVDGAPRQNTEENHAVWDLQSFFGYESWHDPAMEKEMASIEQDAEKFSEKYKGKVKNHLLASLKEYESIQERLSKPIDYLYLSFSTDTGNEKLVTRKSHIQTQIGERIEAKILTFFTLELGSVENQVFSLEMEKYPDLKNYWSFYLITRKKHIHMLPEEIEKALNIREPWSSSNLVVTTYTKQKADVRFEIKSLGVTVSDAGMAKYLFSPNQDLRVEAAIALNEQTNLSKLTTFSALALNSVAGEWHIESKERSYKQLRSMRNLRNNVDDSIVEALLTAIRDEGVKLSKRYFLLKKNILKKINGITTFYFVDRLAPINFGEEDTSISWEEAKELVYSSFASFSPTFSNYFKKLVDENRIHSSIADGKRSGAYCHGTSGVTGPFILMNFDGTRNSVLTLGHEAGHAIHDFLAYGKGYLQYHPGLTLAETASLTGERAVFQALLKRSKSDKERLTMMMSKLDDITGTVIRQASFDRFEELFHTARQKGVVSESDFSSFWVQSLKEFYGEEGEVFDNLRNVENVWAQVPHFINSPFYVYAYAFAELAVGAMMTIQKKSPKDYEEKLLELLRSGGTKDIPEAFAPFGLDPQHPSFWTEAIKNAYGGMIEEAEEIAMKLGLSEI